MRDSHDGVCLFVNTNCWAPPGGATTFYANAGYYRDLVTSRCPPCPAGTFSSSAADACTPCANGYTAGAATASPLGCLCNAGYYSAALFPLVAANGTQCVACPASGYHYYCLGAALPPMPCPSYSGTRPAAPPQTNNASTACQCNAGYAFSAATSACQLCQVRA